MAIVNAKSYRKGSAGGGGVGGAVGGILGVLAAPFTGGASLAAIPALAGVGKAAGGIIDPGKEAQETTPEVSNPMQRRLESMSQPEMPNHSAILEDSLRALSEQDEQTKQRYMQPLVTAYGKSLKMGGQL